MPLADFIQEETEAEARWQELHPAKGTKGDEMTERPILFSGPMVRAILDGRKTMTRRIVRIDNAPNKKQDVESRPMKYQRGIPADAVNVRMCGPYLKCDAPPGSYTVSNRVMCPYGWSGDRLWVRESFRAFDTDAEFPGITYLASWDQIEVDRSEFAMGRLTPGKTYPSIHMPRWASRITLEVCSVRVERLNEISEEDARAEGVTLTVQTGPDVLVGRPYATEFRRLWDSINGKKAPWVSTPWVWVIELRRVLPTKGEYTVVKSEPVEVRGPSGHRRRVPAETLERMERV